MNATAAAPIDCHFHVWGEPFPHRPFPWTPDPCTVDDVLEVFDRHNVAAGFDVTPIMYGWDNVYATQAATASQRIKVFGRIDPFAPHAHRRLSDWMATPGACGARLTFYGDDLRRLDEPSLLDPFWSAACELRTPVAVFAPDGLWTIAQVMERHPDLRLIVDHLGLGVYPGCEDPYAGYPALREFAAYEQVLVKISGVVEVSREPYPFADVQEVVAEARETFGAHRLMWGSNYPVVLKACTYGEALAFVDECGFSEAERSLVLGDNCRQLMNVDDVGTDRRG
jgi:L-fuconolactonase